MWRLIKTEFTKLRSTRTVWGFLAGALTLTVLGVTAAIATADSRNIDLGSADGVRTVLHASAAGAIFVIALGIIGMAGEFRLGTITDTLLTTPRRGRIVAAKVVAYTTTGLVFGTLSIITALAVAMPWLDSKGVPLSLSDTNVWLSVLGAILWAGLYGAVGVSIGALVRNQMTALLGAFAWLLLAEQLIGGFLGGVDLAGAVKWLPGAAAKALGRAPEADLLSMWAGGVVLGIYAVVFALLAVRFTIRRDVT